MINRVVLVGRLTKDPELKYTPSGVAMARFTLAVNRTFKDASGEQQADFINCVVWRKQAENTANYLKKGSLAGVEGRIQTGSYEGQDGKRVYTTDVVADSVQFLEPKNKIDSPRTDEEQQFGTTGQPNDHQRSRSEYQQPQTDPFTNNDGPIEVAGDDLPF